MTWLAGIVEKQDMVNGQQESDEFINYDDLDDDSGPEEISLSKAKEKILSSLKEQLESKKLITKKIKERRRKIELKNIQQKQEKLSKNIKIKKAIKNDSTTNKLNESDTVSKNDSQATIRERKVQKKNRKNFAESNFAKSQVNEDKTNEKEKPTNDCKLTGKLRKQARKAKYLSIKDVNKEGSLNDKEKSKPPKIRNKQSLTKKKDNLVKKSDGTLNNNKKMIQKPKKVKSITEQKNSHHLEKKSLKPNRKLKMVKNLMKLNSSHSKQIKADPNRRKKKNKD